MPTNQKYIVTADIECCVVNVATYNNYNKYVIDEHIPISVVYLFNTQSKNYIGLNYIK